MSSGILTSRREKIRLCKLSFLGPTNQSNLKKSWQLLKTATNKYFNKTAHIPKLDINGTCIEDPRELAILFNGFFTSMPGKFVEDLHTVDPVNTCSGL